MELQAIRIESLVGKTELRIEGGSEQTLVGKIVYREDGRRSLAGGFHQDRRYQPRRPIIGMDNVGVPMLHKVAARQSRGDVVEHRETSRIIGPVLSLLILIGTAGALKQRRAVHEPNRQVRVRRTRGDEAHRTHAHEILKFDLDRFLLRGFDRAWIGRQQDVHVDVKLCERLRESSAYVRQATGFGERVNLRRCKEDTQGNYPQPWQACFIR